MTGKHLSDPDFDVLLAAIRRGASNVEAAGHLEECGECRSAFSLRALEIGETDVLRLKFPLMSGSACPGEADWFRFVSGEVSETEAKRYVQHASTCDACGSLLAVATEDTAELSEDDERLIDSLTVSTENGRQALAEKLARRSTQVPVGRPRRRLVLVLAATFAVLASVFFILPIWQQWRLETRIAERFRDGRPFEFRLDGVPYGALRVNMGSSPQTSSSSLPDAKSSSSWRLDLLEGRTDAAIGRLSALRAEGTASSQVMNDLAAAYAIRGDRTQNDEDYSRALEILAELIKRDPGYTPALFNEGILFERLKRESEMRASLTRFLQLEPDGEWRSEADALLTRRRLQ